jgi:hypothetical protein
MTTSGLISKLFDTGVAEREFHELGFSNKFCRHLSHYNERHLRSKAGTVEGWREILSGFDNRLDALSNEEIGMTIVLLDYFLHKVSAR